jgi:3-hydroxybutyryl-CoA dehydrogenase
MFAPARVEFKQACNRFQQTFSTHSAWLRATTGETPMTADSNPINRVLVVGAGVMGTGIAKSFASGGFDTWLLSRRAGALAGLPQGVRATAEPPKDVPDLVIESIPEEMDLKRDLFRQLEKVYPGSVLIATNTSGLDLVPLFAGMKHPERFLATHYFQPAEVFPMVEVVAGERTDPLALDRVAAAMRRTGKQPIVMRKPIVGFLINRLQHAILHEAYWMIAQGACSVEDVDDVARQMLGPRMCVTGLILQKDISGLAIHAKAQQGIVPNLAHDRTPNPDVQAMVASGATGLAAGKGFYDWGNCDAKAVREQATGRLNALLDFLKTLTATDRPATKPRPRDIRAGKS